MPVIANSKLKQNKIRCEVGVSWGDSCRLEFLNIGTTDHLGSENSLGVWRGSGRAMPCLAGCLTASLAATH